ncbi:hypothetical protein OH77DRAFT_786175 [Trametes cingulata]|nr:hypothetical protein OH77DRAFT_786175 [Trametes cingulata]
MSTRCVEAHGWFLIICVSRSTVADRGLSVCLLASALSVLVFDSPPSQPAVQFIAVSSRLFCDGESHYTTLGLVFRTTTLTPSSSRVSQLRTIDTMEPR